MRKSRILLRPLALGLALSCLFLLLTACGNLSENGGNDTSAEKQTISTLLGADSDETDGTGAEESGNTEDTNKTDDTENTENTENTEEKLSSVTPLAVIYGLSPDAVPLKSGTACREVILNDVTKEEALSAFTEEDFTVLPTVAVEGAAFETVVLTKKTHMVTLYWHEPTEQLRIMWEHTYDNAPEVLAPNEETGVGSVTIAQIGTDRVTEKDNPLNGMCYLVKLASGKAIVIDGGFPNDTCAENLFRSLEAMGIVRDDDGRYQIEAWIFSHGHGDHVGTFRNFALTYGKQTSVRYFMYNLPGDAQVASDDCDEASLETLMSARYPDAQRINPHAGLTYYIGNVTISMLYTPELLYKADSRIAYFNDTSIVYRLEADGGSVLIYGDSAEEASKVMWNLYEPEAFASDILQITHHALYTQANNGHEWVYLKRIYEATGARYAFLPMHARYTGESRNGRYTVMIQWCNNGYQISYVMNESDNHGNTSISQSYYDAFVESVASGTNTYETLYGYDGINKIVSENGLITYTGGNNYEPMATVFTLGNGGATLSVNQELEAWLIANGATE